MQRHNGPKVYANISVLIQSVNCVLTCAYFGCLQWVLGGAVQMRMDTHSVNAVNAFNKFHYNRHVRTNHNCFTTLFPGPLGEPVPEENFWTSWCKGRLTEADTQTMWLGATRSGLTSANLHHPPRNHVNDTCVLTACKCMSVCMHACLRTYMNNANGPSCLKEHTAVQWISKIWEHLVSNITLASHKVSLGLDTVWHY